MAGPKCAHCSGTTFSLSTEKVAVATFPLVIVRCSSCDVAFGVLQQENPNHTIRQEIASVSQKIAALQQILSGEIAQILKRLPPEG